MGRQFIGGVKGETRELAQIRKNARRFKRPPQKSEAQVLIEYLRQIHGYACDIGLEPTIALAKIYDITRKYDPRENTRASVPQPEQRRR